MAVEHLTMGIGEYGYKKQAVATDVKEAGHNPKRIQREVRKQLQNTGIGTKSQQALKLQQEQLKTERKTVSREQREADKQRQFELKQQKRKEKHRGRQYCPFSLGVVFT